MLQAISRGIERLQGDRGYDSEPARRLLRWLGIKPVLAERDSEHGSRLGVLRWFIERTIFWLHSFERLRRRLDPSGPPHRDSRGAPASGLYVYLFKVFEFVSLFFPNAFKGILHVACKKLDVWLP